jgi:hypothetical protein
VKTRRELAIEFVRSVRESTPEALDDLITKYVGNDLGEFLIRGGNGDQLLGYLLRCHEEEVRRLGFELPPARGVQ